MLLCFYVSSTALKIEWCKARARAQRREEEVRLLIEEMRRVREYGRWKARWWKERVDCRVRIPEAPLSDELFEGIAAYAEEHGARELRRVDRLDTVWGRLSSMAEKVLAREAVTDMVDIELEPEEEEQPDMVD